MERRLSMKADFLIQSQADDLSLFARHWPADNTLVPRNIYMGIPWVVVWRCIMA